jgi:3-oxoisoapionate decarboxylase
MSDIRIGVNLEFVRSADKPFDYGIAKAAELGYEYVEPCVMTGRDLLAEAGYYHFQTMDEDGLEMREKLERLGLKASGLSAHAPLMRPDVSVPYIRQAIRFAREVGAPVVNTDEGIKPEWMSEEMAWMVMAFSLEMIARSAERYGIYVGIEPHGVYTTKVDDLLRIVHLVASPWIRINFDTGNSFLAGSDPIADLKKVAKEVVHVHAKDINMEHAERERGKVTGTPVGCACGDGMVDWRQVVKVLQDVGYDGVLSVECGTVDQAARSIDHLKQVLAGVGGDVQAPASRVVPI